MTHSFLDLKRSSTTSFEKLTQELNKLNQPQTGRDERLWTCQTDKAGNGYAIIRFLPAPAGEDVPFVRLFTHGFKGPGGWYMENSLTTLGQQDPVSELNTRLWNSGVESDKEIVRKQKRQLNFYSNIYVVKDPANPENEGKVFLFRYGKKIYDKLNDLMNPAEDPLDPKEPTNPFDLWSGANFKLKIRKVEGYANYDKSEFDTPGPLSNDDAELERIWKAEYSLQELLDPKNFRSYDELKKRLDRALGNAAAPQSAPKFTQEQNVPWDTEASEASAPTQRAAPAPSFPSAGGEEDDDDFTFFKNIALDDE